MKIVLNPEWSGDEVKDFLMRIGVRKGYCPCSIVDTEETKCPCKEFRDKETTGECGCGLFVKVEEK